MSPDLSMKNPREEMEDERGTTLTTATCSGGQQIRQRETKSEKLKSHSHIFYNRGTEVALVREIFQKEHHYMSPTLLSQKQLLLDYHYKIAK